jgi:hypothetical protein
MLTGAVLLKASTVRASARASEAERERQNAQACLFIHDASSSASGSALPAQARALMSMRAATGDSLNAGCGLRAK